jgi:predicted RNA-binding Zn ribbon-like protein
MTFAPAPVLGSPAPPAAALVRDFVNTVEWQEDEEAWQTPADLEAWFAGRAGVPAAGLGEADLDVARRVREGLRSVLLVHAGHEPLAASIAELNDALGTFPLQLRFDPDGSLALAATAVSPLAAPLGVVLDAVQAARSDGTWQRLKACSRDSCRWAYYDGSRNSASRWCSMEGCGNYLKMRRRNAGADAAAAEIMGAVRAPTLVDVAALAGVSMSTASNVVTGTIRVSDVTRARVEAAIERLGYEPNLAARVLRGRRSAGSGDAVGGEAVGGDAAGRAGR